MGQTLECLHNRFVRGFSVMWCYRICSELAGYKSFISLCDEKLFFFWFKKGQLLVSSCLGAGCSLSTDMGRAVGKMDGWMDDMVVGGIFICWK